jgi:hypothetical protein
MMLGLVHRPLPPAPGDRPPGQLLLLIAALAVVLVAIVVRSVMGPQ